MITKEECINLYIDKRLTTYEIAEIYNVNKTTVSKWLKKYNIDTNPKQRKYEYIKKIPFTDRQREIIVGTSLGDAHIALHGRKNKSCRIVIGHCIKQKDFLLWKKAELGNFVNVVRTYKSKTRNSTIISFTSVVHDSFKFYRNLFYNKSGKKIIKPELLNLITPLSLAVWVMDDGSTNGRGKVNMRISTDSFTKKENEMLQSMFKVRFGIKCKVAEYTRRQKKFYYLSFNKKNSIIFSNLIKEYILDSMKYKLVIDRSSETKCQIS